MPPSALLLGLIAINFHLLPHFFASTGPRMPPTFRRRLNHSKAKQYTISLPFSIALWFRPYAPRKAPLSSTGTSPAFVVIPSAKGCPHPPRFLTGEPHHAGGASVWRCERSEPICPFGVILIATVELVCIRCAYWETRICNGRGVTRGWWNWCVSFGRKA